MPTSSIFLSHNQADNAFVDRLARDLRGHGIRVWVDDAEILVGDSLLEKISSAIDEMEYLGVVISRHSVGSEWVRREVNMAMSQEISGKQVKVLPIVVDNATIPGFMRDKFYADFRDPVKYPKALAQLLLRLGVLIRNELEPDMVAVHSGEFIMGSDPKRDRHADEDEQPQHTLYLPTFSISKTLVSVGQYTKFCARTGRPFPPKMHWLADGVPDSLVDVAMTWVTWKDAVSYCEWLSGQTGKTYRLPSEAEWEKASRGTDGRIYPWGDRWEQRFCHRELPPAPCNVNWYLDGASPFGALQMVGSVSQWTRTQWGRPSSPRPTFGYPYTSSDGRESDTAREGGLRIIRGGSFMYRKECLRCAYRNGSRGTNTRVDTGFRVVSTD